MVNAGYLIVAYVWLLTMVYWGIPWFFCDKKKLKSFGGKGKLTKMQITSTLASLVIAYGVTYMVKINPLFLYNTHLLMDFFALFSLLSFLGAIVVVDSVVSR